MTRSHTDKEQLSSMFAFLHTYLKYSGKLNMLDENKVMEDIMCEVLNRVYGWHLVNLNTKEKNYPGIDLGDIQQGLGIQVTADKTSAKIQYTFSKVIAHEVYETYPHIKMMILGEKQSSYTIPELGQYGGKIVFDAKQDVLDFTDLLWGFGHPEQKIVVTSRPIGYDATELSEFKHYQILPIDDGEWEKCKGKVAPEVIEEGLHSRSDIMGECAVYMAVYNIETAGVRDLLISMLRTSSIEMVVGRAGRVLAACEEKNLAMYAEARLMDDAIPSYICLYDYLPKRVEDSAAENWLRIIRRGFMGNRYMVSATLNYILSVEPDNIPQCIKDTLISMVEKSFVEWNQKQVCV